MRRILLILVFVLVSAGIGIALGIMITKPQLTLARTEIEELNDQVREVQVKMDETIQATSAERNRLNDELVKARTDVVRLNKELKEAKSVVVQLQNALRQLPPEALQDAFVSAPPAPPAAAAPAEKPSAAPAAAGREYVVKEGDSFWKIAANQLGSGIRYKEIQELNPQVPPDKPLTIGMKLKLPAR